MSLLRIPTVTEILLKREYIPPLWIQTGSPTLLGTVTLYNNALFIKAKICDLSGSLSFNNAILQVEVC